MDREEARRLREQWGSKPCEHQRIVKELFFGTESGDRICTRCGREFDPSEIGPDGRPKPGLH